MTRMNDKESEYFKARSIYTKVTHVVLSLSLPVSIDSKERDILGTIHKASRETRGSKRVHYLQSFPCLAEIHALIIEHPGIAESVSPEVEIGVGDRPSDRV